MFGWILKRKNKEELVKEETLSVVIPVRMRPSQVDLLDSICALEKILFLKNILMTLLNMNSEPRRGNNEIHYKWIQPGKTN